MMLQQDENRKDASISFFSLWPLYAKMGLLRMNSITQRRSWPLKTVLALTMTALLLAGCTTDKQVERALEKNPDLIFDAIKKNPRKFVDTVNEAVRSAQATAREDEAREEAARMEEEFKNPKKPKIAEDRVVFGNPSAPVTIVEYTDFQCPYCARGYDTIKQIMKEYGDKVRVVLKHLPLDFHPLALPAAKYFEAIAMQDPKKAEKFHDEIFKNQNELNQKGENFLKSAAKKVGADMNRLAKDLKSEKIMKRIEEDMEEAKDFEFSGTPGFLINGVSLRGAYPTPKFKEIIDRHLKEQG